MKRETSNWFAKLIKLLHKTFIFGFYIRFIIESFILYCLAWFFEIKHFGSSQNNRKTSGIISIVIACLLVLFILLGFVQWFKARGIKRYDELNYFRDYFIGVKQTNWKRLYTLMFLSRIFILVSTVTFGNDLKYEVRLSLFCTVQAFYLVIIVACQFQIHLNHNINESICEWCYLVLLIILYFINKEDDWDTTNENTYMYIITANSIIYMMISAIAFISNLLKVCSK